MAAGRQIGRPRDMLNGICSGMNRRTLWRGLLPRRTSQRWYELRGWSGAASFGGARETSRRTASGPSPQPSCIV
jgi:hypothetical protein